ncbi:proline-rich protein 2-like [Schistocerca nitens]|uniref:proline-rich protein 2-like n=1 Tax=Schistocerca nitens TaxID=7011 RepID=UPI002117B469|nr:proline-rich protein 2-like [Schistocerca nitens]
MSAELQQLILLQSQQIQSLVEAIAKQAANPPTQKEQAQAAPPFRAFDASREEWREYFAQLQAHMTVYKLTDLVRGGFQPRLPTSLPPPGQQQQQPSPLPRRQPVPLMPPAQLHLGAPQVVAPAPAVPLQSPPPSELMDVDPSAGPPSQAVAVQPVLQPLSLGTPKESGTAAPCPAPTQQPSTQRQETLPLFVRPDAPSRPVPEAAPVVTGVHPDLGFQSVFPEAPRSQCWGADRGLPPTTVSAPVSSATPAARPSPAVDARHVIIQRRCGDFGGRSVIS